MVVGVIVQGKYRLDLLPFAFLGRDAGASFRLGVGYELVYDAETLGLREGFRVECLSGLSRRLGGSNAVDPVADSGAVASA